MSRCSLQSADSHVVRSGSGLTFRALPRTPVHCDAPHVRSVIGAWVPQNEPRAHDGPDRMSE